MGPELSSCDSCLCHIGLVFLLGRELVGFRIGNDAVSQHGVTSGISKGKAAGNSAYHLPGTGHRAEGTALTHHSFFQPKHLFSLSKFTPSRREEGKKEAGVERTRFLPPLRGA